MKILILILILFVCFKGITQTDTWQYQPQSPGFSLELGPHNDELLALDNTGIFNASRASDQAISNSDGIFISKLDHSGTMLWKLFFQHESINSPDYVSVESVLQDEFGNYYVTGWGQDDNYSSSLELYVFAMKLTPGGSIQWNKIYKVNDSEHVFYEVSDAVLDNNDDLLITGVHKNNGPNGTEWDPFLMKLSSANGSPVWTRIYVNQYNNSLNKQGVSICQNGSDDLALLIGQGQGNWDGYQPQVILLDHDGYPKTSYSRIQISLNGGVATSSFEKIISSSVDNGFYLGGIVHFNSPSNADYPSLLKLNEDISNIDWWNTYYNGGAASTNTDLHNYDNSIFMQGITSNGLSAHNYLIRTDIAGNLTFQNKYVISQNLWSQNIYPYQNRIYEFIQKSQTSNIFSLRKMNVLGEVCEDEEVIHTWNAIQIGDLNPLYVKSLNLLVQEDNWLIPEQPIEIASDVTCSEECTNLMNGWIEDTQGNIITEPIRLCAGEEIALVAKAITSGSTPFVFQWSHGPSGSGLSSQVLINSTGTYTVYIKDGDGCIVTASVDVIVDGGWQQTTSSASTPQNKGDVGNDIHTDEQGYVYATGSFYGKTTFDDNTGNAITITAIDISAKHFYTVCYDPCGKLQWVVYDSYPTQSTGTWSEGFGVDKNGDNVFVGMNYLTTAVLTTVYPNGSTFTYPVSASGSSFNIGNMAVIDIAGPGNPNFGEVIGLLDTHHDYSGRALDVTRTNGALNVMYACGRSDSDHDQNYKAFYTGVGFNNIGNSFSVYWTRESGQEGFVNVANDIKWDARLNRVLLTGTFNNSLSFINTSSGTSQISTAALSDAFVMMCEPSNGYVIGYTFFKYGIQPGGRAQGTCLTTNDDNYIYYGGDFQGTTPSPFQSFNLPPQTSTSAGNSSYIFEYRITAWQAYCSQISNTSSSVGLTSLDAKLGEAVFTGFYGSGLPAISGGGGVFVANNLSPNHYLTYLGSIDLQSSNGWHQPSIINSTMLGTSGDFNHIPSRISVGEEFTFLTGSYFGNLSYNSAPSFLQDLNSTGSSALSYNAFYLRSDLISNQFRSQSSGTGVEDVSSQNVLTRKDGEYELSIKTYPNPTNGLTTVQIEGLESDQPIFVEVFSTTGQLVYSMETSDRIIELDMATLESGIYLLKLNLTSGTELMRIVKE